jgi:hypothetical protein
VSDILIIAALAGVTLIAATLSFVAWHLLGRRPETPDEPERPQLDSEDPPV